MRPRRSIKRDPPATAKTASPAASVQPESATLRGRQVERIALPYLEASVIRAGLQLATPTYDLGVDAIVFSTEGGIFRARPIQMKSFSGRGWSVHRRYEKFQQLLMVYVWRALSDAPEVLVMSYADAVSIAEQRGYTKTRSWAGGGRDGRAGWSVSDTRVDSGLYKLLTPYVATPERWRQLLGVTADRGAE